MESLGDDDVSSLNARKYLVGNDDVKAENARLLRTLCVKRNFCRSNFVICFDTMSENLWVVS